MIIGAILLAAGYSRRFGADKRLAVLPGGRPMLAASAEIYRQVFTELAVTLNASQASPECERLLADMQPAPRILRSENAHLGMGHSLADSVKAVRDWDFAFVGLADMPLVRVETLRRLRQLAEAVVANPQMRERIVLPMHGMRPGHPVGFSAHFYPQLAQLAGDRGARSLLSANSSRIIRVSLDDPGIIEDVDSKQRLAAIGQSPAPAQPAERSKSESHRPRRA